MTKLVQSEKRKGDVKKELPFSKLTYCHILANEMLIVTFSNKYTEVSLKTE